MNKSRWSYVFSCLIIGFVAGVVLFVGGYVYMRANAPTQSVVLVRAPQNGERLEAGQPVQVRALARDDHKITRVELWVDGELVEAETSNTQSGINPFPLLSVWYPEEGAHTLIVRSFNSRNITSQSTINVEAVTSADWDLDGVADEVDACPQQAGFSPAGGCPDRDFDGIPDDSDACPGETGFPEDGCPAPSEGDRDGDGTVDEADACPDVPGSPRAGGCLDGDVDGVADDRDACPEEPGDGEDGCAEKGGGGYEEPETVAVAPPEPFPGSVAPVPGDDELPEGGSIPPEWGFPIGLEIWLRIEAYEMYVGYDFDLIRCFPILGVLELEPIEFEPLGERYWDIAAELGGENSVGYYQEDDDESIVITVRCLGINYGEESVDLGTDTGEYYRADWHGQEHVLSTSVAGPAQYGFVIKFRICTPSCELSPVQAPILSPVVSNPFGGGHLISWRWDDPGLEGWGWTHFRLARYVNGTFSNNVDIHNLDMRVMGVSDYAPACGEVVEFRLRYTGLEEVSPSSFAERNTPWSNTVSWAGEPCTITVNLDFDTLEVHSPPRDEGGHRRPGPIYGEFWATNGSITRALEFDACHCPRVGRCVGLNVESGFYSVPWIFEWIDTRMSGCGGEGCDEIHFSTSSSSYIYLPVHEGDDILFGGLIMDCDKDNPDDVLFRGNSSYRIDTASLEPLTEEIPITIHDRYVDLSLTIRLIR